IAAAQVAEDKRPKYIPRPPKLPRGASAEPAVPANLASLAEPPSPTPPPAESSSGRSLMARDLVSQPLMPAHAAHSGAMNEEPGAPAPSRPLSALPRNVTRNQALAFAGLCLVAGLGFGALVSSDSGALPTETETASASALPGKAVPAREQ